MLVLGVLVPLWAGSLGEVIPDPEVCVSLQQVNRTAPSEAAPLPGWESVLIGIGRATLWTGMLSGMLLLTHLPPCRSWRRALPAQRGPRGGAWRGQVPDRKQGSVSGAI